MEIRAFEHFSSSFRWYTSQYLISFLWRTGKEYFSFRSFRHLLQVSSCAKGLRHLFWIARVKQLVGLVIKRFCQNWSSMMSTSSFLMAAQNLCHPGTYLKTGLQYCNTHRDKCDTNRVEASPSLTAIPRWEIHRVRSSDTLDTLCIPPFFQIHWIH